MKMNEFMYEAMYEIERTHWWFRARRDIVLETISPRNKQKIVDFGCGTGIMLESLYKFGDPTGLDNSITALDFCRKRVGARLVRANLQEPLPLEAEYDIGVALDVLEHLEDDLLALQNMKSVLKHGGELILTVPAFMSLWSAHDLNCAHKRRYSRKRLESLIEKAGFEIDYLSYYNYWLFPLIALLRCVFKLLGTNKNSDMENKVYGKSIDHLLFNIFKSEIFFIRRNIRMPFGVSLIAILRRR